MEVGGAMRVIISLSFTIYCPTLNEYLKKIITPLPVFHLFNTFGETF